MSQPIVFSLAAAQEAQNRLDDGLYTDEEKPRLVELAAQYEGWCQQEYGRFLEEVERAERARWLATQCGGCVEGGSGELCDEHWTDEPGGGPVTATMACPRGHGPMVRRDLAATAEQQWGTWWDCPVQPADVVVQPSAELVDHLRQVAPPCVTCGTGRAEWPVEHRLYLPGSRQCPLCVEADIDDDRRASRREDV